MGICPGCLRREPCPPPGWAFVVVYAVSKHVIPLRLDYIMDASPASSGEWEQSCSQTPVPLRKVSIRGAFLPAPQCYYYLVVVCLFVFLQHLGVQPCCSQGFSAFSHTHVETRQADPDSVPASRTPGFLGCLRGARF